MHILQLFLFIFLAYSAYMFILVLSGLLYRPKSTGSFQLPKIKILLPAYQPDAVFSQALQQLKMVTAGHPVEVFILFLL